MKKVVLTVLAFALLLVGCGKADTSKNNIGQQQSAEESTEKLKVYATIYPLYDFTKQIGGDKVDVELVVPNGQEPHDYEPSNELIKNLEHAKLFIFNGAGLESWTDKVLKSLDNKELVSVEASKGIKFLKGHDEDHDGSKQEEALDPHVWLDPENAKIQAKNIAEGLSKVDPKNSEYYNKNLEDYLNALNELNEDYKKGLADIQQRTIVVSHEAYGYLCKEYGLEQIGIEGVNAETEPDAKTMAEIVDLVKEKNIKVIYTEDILDPKVAATIAKEAHIKTAFLNPLESLTDEEIANNDNYITIMKANLVKLEEGLK